MNDFFKGKDSYRMKLTQELLDRGIMNIYIERDPRQIKIEFDLNGDPQKPLVFPVLEFPYPTVDQLDALVDGSMSLDTLTVLKGYILTNLGEHWSKLYTPNRKQERTKIQVAFDTVRQQVRNLFIDEYKTPYLAIPTQDHLEIIPVNSNSFKDWYRMFIFDRDGISLDGQTINDLCSLASAYARSSKYGEQINLNLRTASNLNFGKLEWNYDLTNKNWEFMKITSNGWNIFKDEIIFRRYNNQQSQVYPDRNYESDIFDKFMKLVNININDKDTILLLKCYIISLFIPDIQKVALMLFGSQDAAKSSLQELIKTLVDPGIAKTLTFPRNLNELIQQLSHNYVTYYDNISRIPSWISDQLCRAVSGSASSQRQLYTNDDDIIRTFKRSIGINGINLAATKPDLLDRSIIIKLERIKDGNQRTPEDIWKEFEEIRPRLLGYILDILVKVLHYQDNNRDQKFKLSRMTEFSKYGEIIARCMGYPEDEFIKVYERNREIQTDEIIESSQLATVIMCMMYEKYGDSGGEPKKEWIGTPTDLYVEIKSIVENDIWNLNIDTKDRYWPRSTRSLGRRLNELLPALGQKGLEIVRYKDPDKNKTKKIKIRKMSSETSEMSEHQNLSSFLPKISDDIGEDIKSISSERPETSSENITKIRAQNEDFGRETTSDDIIHTSIVESNRAEDKENLTTNAGASSILVEKKPSAASTASQAKSSKKCPKCDYETEGFYIKVHLEGVHGITRELEIRESEPSEYRPKAPITWNGNVADSIKIKGTEIGDQIVFDAYPAAGNFTLKNNFITGHLRMRGRGGGQYPYKYLEFINRVFDAALPSRTIEVCSNRILGLNKCGKCFTVDINPEYKPDFVTDGQTLEGIKDDYFDRWRCDPPYNGATAKEMYGTELPSLYKLLETGARVIKPGSLMFLLCSQNYQPFPTSVKRIGFIYISVVPNNETRVLNIYVKLGNAIFANVHKSTKNKKINEAERT